MNSHEKTIALVEGAIMIALSVVLSMIKVVQLPLGGAVTLFSMLPICVYSIRHGIKWGFGASFVYALIQMFLSLGEVLSWGLTPVTLIGCLLFDYLIAFTVLGIAGIFRKKGRAGMVLGTVLALFLRFVSHFISGYVIFANLEQWEAFGKVFNNQPALYSIAYNGFYMLPELIMTVAAVLVLSLTPAFRKILNGERV